MNHDVFGFILGTAPNFGATFLGIGLLVANYSNIFKREFDRKNILLVIGLVNVILFLSEIVHHFFLNAPFDIWDMVAGVIASFIFIVISAIIPKHT